MSARRTCYIHLKPKLTHLDNVLPFVMELVEAEIISKPKFIASSRQSSEMIKSNIVLFDAIQSIGGELIYVGRWNNRWLNQLWNLWVLREYLFRSCLTIQTAIRIGVVVRFLTAFNWKLLAGKSLSYLALNTPSRIYQRLYEYSNAIYDRARRDPLLFSPKYPLVVSYFVDRDELLGPLRLSGDTEQIEVGNPRRMSKWQNFLRSNARDYIPNDMPTPYFLFVLSTLELPNPSRDNVFDDSHVKNCLRILRDYNDRIHTVFKPHPATDIPHFMKLLEDSGYANYTFINVHPMMLAATAKFTFAYYSSTVLLDAFALGCPTVDYVSYDSRGRSVTDGQSLLLNYADYFFDEDEHGLRRALDGLVDGDDDFIRDEKNSEIDFPTYDSRSITDKFAFLR